jgi:hypothetical protein
MTYEDFPLVLFFKLMGRPEAVAHRIVGKRPWEKIKERWELNHEDSKGEAYLDARRKVLSQTIKLNKLRLLVEWIKKSKRDPKEVYTACRLPWNEDPKIRAEYLDSQIAKSEQLLEIYEAQYQRIKGQQKAEESEEEESPFTLAKLHEAIASLELHGYSIPDYNQLTLGKYDAMTAVIKRKIEDEQRRTNTG